MYLFNIIWQSFFFFKKQHYMVKVKYLDSKFTFTYVDTMVISMESKYRKETHIKESIGRSRERKKEI